MLAAMARKKEIKYCGKMTMEQLCKELNIEYDPSRGERNNKQFKSTLHKIVLRDPEEDRIIVFNSLYSACRSLGINPSTLLGKQTAKKEKVRRSLKVRGKIYKILQNGHNVYEQARIEG